jgi:hypothetical protein
MGAQVQVCVGVPALSCRCDEGATEGDRQGDADLRLPHLADERPRGRDEDTQHANVGREMHRAQMGDHLTDRHRLEV